MSDPAKPSLDVRPYAVRDALDPGALPRVVIHGSQAAAISHVVGQRFTAAALNAMEVLSLAALGARVEDPRNTMPVPAAPATSITPTPEMLSDFAHADGLASAQPSLLSEPAPL